MKRFLSLVIALLLVFSVGSFAALAEEEPIEINLIMRNIGNASSNDNDIFRAIEEATGYKINIELKPGSDYSTTCQMVIASGDYPDAMEWHCSIYPNDLQMLADDGLLLPLDDLLEEYGQNILAHRDSENFFRSSSDGKIYGIPCRVSEYGYNNYAAIRNDWLDKLELETPTNSEELFNVLTAFKEHAAELVGEDVEFWPMGACQDVLGISDSIFDLFASENSFIADWNEVDGELVYYINMPGYKNALATIREFYQAGLIDPEYPLMTRDDMLEKWYNNAYGMWLFYLDNSDPVLGSWASQYYGYYPEAEIGAVIPFEDENGVAQMRGSVEKQMLVIFKDAKHPEAVVDLMNYLISDEGVDLVQLGIKGVDWDEDAEGNVTIYEKDAARMEEMGYKNYYLYMMQGYLTPARCYDESVIAIGESRLDMVKYQIVLDATPTYLANGTTLNDIAKTYATRLIVEKDIDFDAVFNEYIEKWNTSGGAQWTEEYNELYKAKQAA